MKLQYRLYASFFFFMLTAGALPAGAQTSPSPPPNAVPPQAAPPQPVPMVRICDDTGCSYRPKDAISAEMVNSGVEREEPGIVKLKQIAETQPKAAYDLGLRYFRGEGVQQDSYRALVWMRKAGEGGNLQAQKALGAFYLFGLEEMGSDPQEAEKWLLMAIAQGDKESNKLLEQARAAKKSEQEDFKNHQRERERLRSVYYGYWHSGYPYYGAWRRTGWYGY